jgi:hypothetical protein
MAIKARPFHALYLLNDRKEGLISRTRGAMKGMLRRNMFSSRRGLGVKRTDSSDPAAGRDKGPI